MESSLFQAALWRNLTVARSTARVEDACEAQLDVSDSLSVQCKSFTHRHVDVGGEERSTLSFPQHKHLKSETEHQTAAWFHTESSYSNQHLCNASWDCTGASGSYFVTGGRTQAGWVNDHRNVSFKQMTEHILMWIDYLCHSILDKHCLNIVLLYIPAYDSSGFSICIFFIVHILAILNINGPWMFWMGESLTLMMSEMPLSLKHSTKVSMG